MSLMMLWKEARMNRCKWLDPDNDGLTNLEEFQNGTRPQVADTDGDGLFGGGI